MVEGEFEVLEQGRRMFVCLIKRRGGGEGKVHLLVVQLVHRPQGSSAAGLG